MLKTIDSGVHNEVPHLEALLPYLPELWVEQIGHTVFRGPFDYDQPYPPSSDAAVQPQSRVNGGPPGLALIQQQVLSPVMEKAILLCTYGVSSLHNPDQAVALARAVNDWQVAEWLDRDDRLRASIVVPSQIPSLAAAEIERVADHPGFVQVALPVRAHHPYGNRLFHPLWEAIVRHGLVAGIHFGGAPGNATSPVGWPSYFAEDFVNMAGVFAAQTTNLIVEGVFDKFPKAKVTLHESGVTWLPTHLWRMDKEWKNLRLQVPWVRRPPSAYLRDHFRLTTAAWDQPRSDSITLEILDQLGSEELLLYSSGYPHGQPAEPLPINEIASADLAHKINYGNAQEWYR